MTAMTGGLTNEATNNLTREENARLLELMGGCRHEWTFSHYVQGFEVRLCSKPGCGARSLFHMRPDVGDGHRMPLDEMLDLAAKLWPESLSVRFTRVIKRWQVDIYADNAKPVAEIWGPELPNKAAALGRAILAAVNHP